MSYRVFNKFGSAVICLLIGSLIGGCSLFDGIESSYSDIEVPRVDFSPASVRKFSMPNGLQVFYLEDKELPLVKGNLYFPGGSYYEKVGEAGISSATGDQMRAGGTTSLRPAQLDEKLESLGASIESSFGDEFGSVSFMSLEEDFTEVFDLFADVVLNPRFDKKRLALWKRQSADSIAQRSEMPGTMASMAFTSIVYGEGSPFANWATKKSLSRITPLAMKQLHKKYVRPDQAILVITGSINEMRVKEALERKFAGWVKGGTELSKPVESVRIPAGKPKIYLLEKDFDQSAILLGHQGPPRLYDEMFSVAIFNRIFGIGSFDNQLFSEVRSKAGLAYTVYGGFFPDMEKGVFKVSIETKNDTAIDSIKRVLELMNSNQQNGISSKDVANAKEAAKKSFIFRFSTPSQVSNRAAVMEILGYPDDYDRVYAKEIDAVSLNSVRKALKKWFKPDQLVIIIVGKVSEDDIVKSLGHLGGVSKLSFDEVPTVIQ